MNLSSKTQTLFLYKSAKKLESLNSVLLGAIIEVI